MVSIGIHIIHNYDHILRPCNVVKDLGVTVQSNLRSVQHCTEIANKANTRAKLILKAFLSRDPDIYAQAFVTYVRPLLEYCSPAWNPHFKCDIDVVKKVQRSFTRKVYYMCDLSPANYNERLERLGLTRLELRRIHADLILMFKISHSLIHSNLLPALHFANQRQGMATRGHRYKLMTESTSKLVLCSFYINRVTSMWNFYLVIVFILTTYSVINVKFVILILAGFYMNNLGIGGC